MVVILGLFKKILWSQRKFSAASGAQLSNSFVSKARHAESVQGVLAGQRQIHVIFWVNILEADRALVFPFESLRILNLFGSTWAPVGLGNAEELVLLPVCLLAVRATIRHQTTASTVGQLLLFAFTVLAGFILVTRRGLLFLGRHSD